MEGEIQNLLENLKISQASIRDLANLRKLEEIAFPIDRWPLLDLIGVLTIPGVVRLKAEQQDVFAGFVAGDVRLRKEEGWITTIAVHPQFRRLGVAGALLDTCEQLMGVKRIFLTVRKSNLAALSLYQKRGYQQTKSWPNYYIDGEDGIVLQKTVDFN